MSDREPMPNHHEYRCLTPDCKIHTRYVMKRKDYRDYQPQVCGDCCRPMKKIPDHLKGKTLD